MRVRALESFSGAFSMYKGEEKECSDRAILQDLIKARYVEEVKEGQKTGLEPEKQESKPKKDVKSSEGKRNHR